MFLMLVILVLCIGVVVLTSLAVAVSAGDSNEVQTVSLLCGKLFYIF